LDGFNSLFAEKNNSSNIDENACIKCSVYETPLKEALDELGSARFIIDILQKELITAVSAKDAHGYHLTSTEEFVDTKPRRRKVSSSKWENSNILVSQRSHPVPVVVNRYAPLDIIQEEPEAFRNHNTGCGRKNAPILEGHSFGG
jgi:hypothetical protein